MSQKLQILLATYNSGAYLAPQLDSILAQDFPDFEVLIRDGGSSDGTMELISRYREKFTERIVFVGRSRSGACENFSELLQLADGELLMFSDHDDIWMPDKISAMVAEYWALESRYGAQTPILIFSDAMVVDRKLKRVSDSLFDYQKLDPRHLSLNRLILQNVPSGNAMLLNRALADLSLPIPEAAVMHDHWISLVASVFGRIGFLERPTLYYRQHEDNVYGAFRYNVLSFVHRLKCGRKRIRERFEQNIVQAAEFGRVYGDRLAAPERELLTALTDWSRLGFWGKRKLLWKYRVRKTGLLRNLGMYLTV